MKLLRAARGGILALMGGLAVAPSLGAGVSLTACGESGSCSKLRNDTYAAKETWDACDPNDQEPCIKVFGNPKDCTGVLACDFAVKPIHRAEAEQAVLTIAQQSLGCYLCAVPNCPAGSLAVCEPVTKRCIIVTEVLGNGLFSVGTQQPDSGPTNPQPDAASE